MIWIIFTFCEVIGCYGPYIRFQLAGYRGYTAVFLLFGSGSGQNVEWNQILQLNEYRHRKKLTYLLATKLCYSLQSATKQQ